MRFATLIVLALVGGCNFGGPAQTVPEDGKPKDMSLRDGMFERTRDGLIGAWTFDDQAGPTVHDSSGVGIAVDLQANGAVTFGQGMMTVAAANPAIVVASPTAVHFNADIQSSNAVTLEAWVSPSLDTQGMVKQPVVVAGLCSTVASRNISLLQGGDRWLGRVRTNMVDVDWANGGPDLLPMPMKKVATTMTHLVVVADSTTRALYVNGDKLAETPAQAPIGWDASYKMVMANEISLYRPWVGTYALVALYNRALPEPEIMQNFLAGPTAAP